MGDLPPSYSSLFINEHRSGISYIDIMPFGVKDGFFSKPNYDRFEKVVECANEWLRLNPQWEINTCESIEFKDKDGGINPTKMSYFENTNRYQIQFIRGLRLWLKVFPPGETRVQKIGYVNLVPQAVTEDGIFSHAKYETLDDVLLRFNNTSRSSPLPGRIITIETQAMKIKSGGVIDPDRSHWTEYNSNRDNRFVYIIRIFYEVGDPFEGEIGVTDFIPEVTSRGFLSSRYEDFPTLFNKASQWCSSQSSLRICNMQSLPTKVKGAINTKKMSYTVHEGPRQAEGHVQNRRTPFVRTLRIAYIRRQSGASPIQFSCKSFAPTQLQSGFFSPEFETLQQTMQIVSNWIQATGAEVLNMETTAVRLSRKGPDHSSNKTYYYDSALRECYIFIIRAYLKGAYNKPVN